MTYVEEKITSPLLEALIAKRKKLEDTVADNPWYIEFCTVNYMIEREYLTLYAEDYDLEEVDYATVLGWRLETKPPETNSGLRIAKNMTKETLRFKEPRSPKPAQPETKTESETEAETPPEPAHVIATATDSNGESVPSIASVTVETTELAEDVVIASRKQRDGGFSLEKREEIAKKATKPKKPPFDSDFESVKADFDAGMTTGEISNKWNCSDAHIRNFLTKHGVDPRRGRKSKQEQSEEAEAAPDGADKLADYFANRGKPEEPEATKPANGKPYVPVSAETLIEKHNGYAGKRDPGQDLVEEDWPDIQNMLEKKRMSVGQIASDYDVEWQAMKDFVDRHVLGNPKPGEARAALKPAGRRAQTDQEKIEAFIAAKGVKRGPSPFTKELADHMREQHERQVAKFSPSRRRGGASPT